MTTTWNKPLPTQSPAKPSPSGTPAAAANWSSSSAKVAVNTSGTPAASAPTAGMKTSVGSRPRGRGTVWTYTITQQNRTTGFAEMVPYVLALVELEEGVRMFTNIVDCNPRDVHIGMAVEVTFQTATPQITIPYFKPAS